MSERGDTSLQLALPMTSTQQGMLVDSLVKSPADYHVGLHLRLDPIEPLRIDRAVRLLVESQPALRSAIGVGVDGMSYLLAPSVDPLVVHHDLRGRPAEAAADELSEITEAVAGAAFDLSAPPLFRVAHCRLAVEDRLILVCHHLIADGLSISIRAEQLIELAVADEPVDLPSDTGFEVYQRHDASALTSERSTARGQFWQRTLGRQEVPNLSHWITSATGDQT